MVCTIIEEQWQVCVEELGIADADPVRFSEMKFTFFAGVKIALGSLQHVNPDDLNDELDRFIETWCRENGYPTKEGMN